MQGVQTIAYLVAALVLLADGSTISPRVVHTHYGLLRGVVRPLKGPGLFSVEQFLGVPYATAPVNGLRFMPPLTPSPWEGIKMADRPASPCSSAPESSSARFNYLLLPERNASEDCLYLNIFYPIVEGQIPSNEKPPVVLLVQAESWLHSSANLIDASILAARGRLMVATVNFRLGALGFLKTSPRESPQGNYGVLDVIAAVHWLRLNAAAFGADAGRLSLIGIGHGAAIVNLIMLSPVARGLFQGAVLLGGSALGPGSMQQYPEEIRQLMAQLSSCWDANDPNAGRYDLAPCLRRLGLDQLNGLQKLITSPRFLPTLAPFVDGSLLRGEPRDLMKSAVETFVDCDLLVGVSALGVNEELDGDSSRPAEPWTSERRDRVLRTFVRNVYTYHNNEIFAVLRNEYTDWEVPSKTSALRHALHEALSDGLIAAPLMEVLRYHSSASKRKTYMYHLSHPNNHDVDQQATAPAPTSFRGDDVYYLLGVPLISSQASHEDVDIAEQLIAYIAGFSYAGDPNEHGGSLKFDNKDVSGFVYWEPFTQTQQLYLSLGTRTRLRSHYRSHKMSVWLQLLPQLHQPGGESVPMSHHHFRASSTADNSSVQSNLYEGIVRPLIMTRPVLPVPKSTDSPSSAVTAEPPAEPRTTPECPTLPPYVAIATQQLSNSSGAPTDPRGNVSHPVNETADDDSASASSRPYTTMLGLTVAVGTTLLVLNLLIIASFCYFRRKQKRAAKTAHEKLEAQKEANEALKMYAQQQQQQRNSESISSVIDLTQLHVAASLENCVPVPEDFRSAVSLHDLKAASSTAGLHDSRRAARSKSFLEINV